VFRERAPARVCGPVRGSLARGAPPRRPERMRVRADDRRKGRKRGPELLPSGKCFLLPTSMLAKIKKRSSLTALFKKSVAILCAPREMVNRQLPTIRASGTMHDLSCKDSP